MDIGVFQARAWLGTDAVSVAVKAEDLGFESYWAPDHTIMPTNYSVQYPGGTDVDPEPDYLWQIPDPLMVLSSVVSATKSIKLGTGVLLVPERNPILTAKQIATLDKASNGRFLFGVGAGWNPEECEILGGDFKRRWTQVRENLEIMKVLWLEHEPEFRGRYYSFPKIRCYPKPAQKPHPPILLGAINNPRSLKRVAQYGDGWIPVVQTVEEFRHGVIQIKDFCEEHGRNFSDLDFTVFGIGDQWKTKADIISLKEAGANRVVLWLDSSTPDEFTKELSYLASECL